jgi:hypothetical protein
MPSAFSDGIMEEENSTKEEQDIGIVRGKICLCLIRLSGSPNRHTIG